MCKLFMATGKLNKQTQRDLLWAVNNEYASSQRDGFGFVSAGESGKAYGRYIDPKSFTGFNTQALLPPFLQFPCQEEGELPETAYVLMAHGRTSTNKVCKENVHPFHRDGAFLAHNGTLRWTGQKHLEPIAPNGCDSEEFFIWLMGGGTWQEAGQSWGGFGAVMVVDTNAGHSLIAQDDARLHGAKRAKGDGWLFATDDRDLWNIAKAANISLATRPIQIPRRLMVFDRTGKMIEDHSWSGFGSASYGFQEQRAFGGHGGAHSVASDYVPGSRDETFDGKKWKKKYKGKITKQEALGNGANGNGSAMPMAVQVTAGLPEQPVSIPVQQTSHGNGQPHNGAMEGEGWPSID